MAEICENCDYYGHFGECPYGFCYNDKVGKEVKYSHSCEEWTLRMEESE